MSYIICVKDCFDFFNLDYLFRSFIVRKDSLYIMSLFEVMKEISIVFKNVVGINIICIILYFVLFIRNFYKKW